MKHDPELQDDECEWFLCYSDGDCGLMSATGAMIEALRVKSARRVDDVAEEARRFRLRDVTRARLSINLQRRPSTFEVETSVFYAEKFGVGVCAAHGANSDMHAASSPDLYGDAHSTFASNPERDHTRSHFARLRRCCRKWQALSDEHRRTLAAHYQGMNPESPADVRLSATRVFGIFAAVGVWFFDDEAIVAASNDNGMAASIKGFAESEVRDAHRSWAAA